MPTYFDDNLERLDDLESLLVTALSIARRLSADELEPSRKAMKTALSELRDARLSLVEKWKISG